MSDIRACMIGPKAENVDLFRQLVIEALDDHLRWRRNFYPGDNPAISSSDKSTEQFRNFENRLRELLFEFLADAKSGVPFFSPRYVGHMNTDLLLPGLVGYFASMLYNQNNVAGESSPTTCRLEHEVIAMLARMVGFRPAAAGKAEEPGGYLCSGGTTANIYSLWVARNLRTWPLALRVAIANAGPRHASTAAIVRDLPLPGPRGTKLRLAESSAWELWNVPVRGSLYPLKKLLKALLGRSGERSYETDAQQERAIDELVAPWTLQALGEQRFYQAVAGVFSDERGFCERAPLVMMASNRHYSFLKALDLLGLGKSGDGRGALAEISLTDDFTLDPDALRDRLAQALERRERVLTVVSIFGSTDEGSLDDLPLIRSVCREFEDRGLASWLHVDGCYGGYLGAMIREEEDARGQSGAELATWIREFARDFGVPGDVAESYLHRSDEGHGWLTWDAFATRVAGMAEADSIAIDPHKLGYVPYPAGAVLLRDRAAAGAVSYDAPYLWTAERTSASAVMGRHTLEGSRPGAAAAACWLAHRAVPLSQKGHGQLLAASILATRELYGALEARSRGHQAVKIAFINKPHTNMICYIPYHVESRDLGEARAVCDVVAAKLSPAHYRDFMVVQTTVQVTATEEWMADRFVPSCAERFFRALDVTTDIELPVLRSVVMGPLALGATTGLDRTETRGLFDLYSEHLVELTEKAFLALTTTGSRSRTSS
jgi:glutamate/tyrosine decarboxylase-like PLP-dependent enzyme